MILILSLISVEGCAFIHFKSLLRALHLKAWEGGFTVFKIAPSLKTSTKYNKVPFKILTKSNTQCEVHETAFKPALFKQIYANPGNWGYPDVGMRCSSLPRTC